ncbi:MAG: GH1 family beta-glucosidase [Acidimicrobiia bacterium]|nr:GH1 family beta-glucosidase [Acidimicrobiia bacterium]
MTNPVPTFPEGFLWGTATSSYQIEGAVTAGGRGPSIWDTFSHTPGKTYNGDTGDVAVDHFHRLREDVALMEQLGLNAYRFSIAWSRLLPDGRGAINQDGVAFYRQLGERLRAAGITPVATLYHWDLPQALQDEGGWLSPHSPDWFAEYAAVAKEQLGDLISIWSTLNEPWCSAFLGHSEGSHAPGITDPASSYVAAHHLMLGHHRAIRAMRETNRRPDDQLGIVLNLIPAWPATNEPEDVAAANAIDAVHNQLFLEAVLAGRYPQLILDYHDRFGVGDRIDATELAEVREDIDYLGVNYYNVNLVRYVAGAPAMAAWPGSDGSVMDPPPGELTDMGWGVEPAGLKWTLLRVAEQHPGLPLYVCENGAAYPDVVAADGSVADPKRIAYLEGHLAALGDAMAAGADVRGYFVWSLLDNFEWAHGYQMRFGLVRVDLETMQRTIKASGYWYRDFIAGQRS